MTANIQILRQLIKSFFDTSNKMTFLLIGRFITKAHTACLFEYLTDLMISKRNKPHEPVIIGHDAAFDTDPLEKDFSLKKEIGPV